MDIQQGRSQGTSNDLANSLRDLQGDYVVLSELYGKQETYARELAEMMTILQGEVDEVIQIRPDAIGVQCTAAYLLSEGVLLTFDANRHMTSRPLHRLPPEAIVAVVEDCAPALRRLLQEKRQAESEKVRSLEKVFRELKKAEDTFSIFSGGRSTSGSQQLTRP